MPVLSHYEHTKQSGTPTRPPQGAFTFFLVQGEVDAGLPLGAVAEPVEGKQVAFPVVAMKIESPVWKGGTREAVCEMSKR